MSEFIKPPTTLTCWIRNHIVYADPEGLYGLNKEGDLCRLLESIQIACKIINRRVRHSALNLLSSGISQNVDVGAHGSLPDGVEEGFSGSRLFAHHTMVHFLANSGQLCVATSTVDPDAIIEPQNISDELPIGQFCVAFDPLDGFSNSDSRMATVFGIYRRTSPSSSRGSTMDLMQVFMIIGPALRSKFALSVC